MKGYKTIIMSGSMSTIEIDELLNRQDEKGWSLISHCVEKFIETSKDDKTIAYMPKHYFIFFHP